jgi:Family of unknown function (DUF6131)
VWPAESTSVAAVGTTAGRSVVDDPALPGPWQTCYHRAVAYLIGYMSHIGPYRSKGLILLGVILMIIGFIASIPILWTIGIILAVIGVVLALMGSTGRAVGGRRHYY